MPRIEVGSVKKFAVNPVDIHGAPAPIDGAAVWSVDNELIGTVTASADGKTAEFTAIAPGSAVLNVLADVDLGAGVKTLGGSITIEVVALEATTLNIEEVA